MLRKSIALIMSVCMLLSLCACGKSDNKKSNSKNSSDESNITDTYEDNPSFEAPEDNTENFTTTTTKPEVKLSESCSTVLCSGTDGSDYYELVANQIDGYPDSTFEFGVIKNNQWLVPMGSDCPFIDDKGWWMYPAGTNKPRDFEYIGAGCFYYNWRDPYDPKILYKPETGVSVVVDRIYENPNSEYGKDKYSINDQAEIIIRLEDSENKYPLVYINMNTGERKTLPLDSYDIDTIGIISEGLFFATTDEVWEDPQHSFYDLNGNKVIDLSSYTITDLKARKFTDGKYTFTVKNSSNILFDITIDTTGKVLSQEKAES